MRKDSVHLDIIVACLAQHIHHLADEILVVSVRPLRDAHHGTVVGGAPFEFLLRDDDIVYKKILLSDEESDIPVDTQTADEGILLALQDLDDHRLLDMILPPRQELHPHPVVRQRSHRVALRDKDRCASVIRLESILAVRLAQEYTFLHLPFRVQTVSTVAHTRQKIIPCHLLHHVDGQHFGRMGGQFQRTEYLFETKSVIR